MKCTIVGLFCLLALCVGSTVNAQCGCGGSYPSHNSYTAPPVASHYLPPAAPRPMPSMTSSSVAFVNKLATPVPRANYTLNYAVHLADGRILLSDFLPPGQTVRGVESQTGVGGRRLNANNLNGGTIAVVDPVNNSPVTTFAPGNSY